MWGFQLRSTADVASNSRSMTSTGELDLNFVLKVREVFVIL